MTSYKRIDGDYYIQTIDPPTQKVYIDTDTTVSGNLTVQGNLTYINVDELNVKDPFILVNSSNTGTYSSNSGLLTHRTASNFAGIRYNNTSAQWELSSSTDTTGLTGSWTPIATGSTVVPGGANTAVQFNDGSGAFGGNANLTFDYATSRLTLTGTAALAYQSAPPTSVANTATMVANTPGSGGTGIYFTNGSDQDELISKSKAIVFSIIF
jgi:hypothetical protein